MHIDLARRTAGRAPIYRQIANHIRGEIQAGRLDAGDRLPPIRELARSLSVNRDTVALAYDELVGEGHLEATVGRGTFVRSSPPVVVEGEVRPAALAPRVEALLDFERTRPRYGAGAGSIPLHALVPDPALYPVAAFRRSVNRVLERGGADLLLYGDRQGDAGLRELLAQRFRAHGIEVGPAEITLCHGASQGIALALRLFCAPGDVVALEEPTYNNVLGAALALGIRTAPVPMREDGVDLARLEQTLARPEVKALYTIPTFHNPMGTTTGLAHRRALLDVARRAGVPVIEDGYEMDLRFAGASVAPLAGLDPTGGVVHLFSFSKSLFPGARVGAVSVRGRLREALLALKHASDLSDALPLQVALAEFVASGEYDRHLARLRRVLRGRRDALLDALAAHMPEGSRWTHPEGGYQVWLELPGVLDTRDLLADAVAQGVLFAPGSQFYSDGRPSNGLRLSFAMAGEDALRSGVERLARVVAAHHTNGEPASARVPV